MNVVFSALVWLTIITVIMFTWYVTQPLAVSILNVCLSFLHSMNITTADGTYSLSTWLANLWGPILAAFVTLWFLIFGTRQDTESSYYAGR